MTGSPRELRVSTVTASTFGGLTNRSVDLGASSFVVVSGCNETGKSSLATLMSWLLVGPYGHEGRLAELAQRFGDPTEIIGGELTGRLGSAPVSAKGRFKVNERSAPKESGLAITVDGTALASAAVWRSDHLGGIDAATLKSIYLLSGATLHDDTDVINRIRELAIGGMSGADKAHQTLDTLAKRAKDLLETTREGSRSVKATEAMIKQVNTDVRSLSDAAVELAKKQAQHEKLQAEINRWEGDISALEEAGRATEGLKSAATELCETLDAIQDLRRELGLTEQEACDVRLSTPRLLRVATASGELSRARTTAATAKTALETAAGSVTRARTDLINAGVSPEVGSTRVSDAVERQLRDAIGNLRTSEVLLGNAQDHVNDAAGTVQQDEAALEAAEKSWRSFGLDSDPHQWLANTGARNPARDRGLGNEAAILALLTAAAVLAIVLLPTPAAMIVTLAAFATAFLVARRLASRTVGSSTQALTEAAKEVLDSQKRLADSEGNLEAKKGKRDIQQRDCDTQARKIAQIGMKFDLLLQGSSEDLSSQLDSAVRLSGLAERVDYSEGEFHDAESKYRKFDEVLGEAIDELQSATDDAGIPSSIDPELVAAISQQLAGLSAHNSNLPDQQSTFTEALDNYLKLGAPSEREAGGGVGGASLSTSSSPHDIDGSLLDHQVTIINDEIGIVRSKIGPANQEIGGIDEALSNAQAHETISSLQLQLGNLTEQRNELLTEAAAVLLAHDTLADVTAEQQRLNQPQIITRATELLQRVVPDWGSPNITLGDSTDIVINRPDGTVLPVTRISTGGRALLYLALRIAAAEHDSSTRRNGLRFPLICDDPLVHLDEARAVEATKLLAAAANDGFQIILFTCHDRTTQAACAHGAHRVDLD